jgi:hypothetical protein
MLTDPEQRPELAGADPALGVVYSITAASISSALVGSCGTGSELRASAATRFQPPWRSKAAGDGASSRPLAQAR